MRLSREEKEIRRKLQAHEAGVDTRAIWEGVSAELRPKRKRRLILFWIFLCGLLAGGSLGWWLWQPEAEGKLRVAAKEETPEFSGPNSFRDIIQTQAAGNSEAGVAPAEVVPSASAKVPGRNRSQNTSTSSVWQEVGLSANEDADGAILLAESLLEEAAELAEENTIFATENWSPTASLPVNEPTLILSEEEGLLESPPLAPPIRRPSLWRTELELRLGAGSFSSRTMAAGPEQQALAREWAGLERPLEALNLQVGVRLRHRSGAYLSAGLAAMRLSERWSQERSRVEWDTLPNQVTGIYLPAGGDTVLQQGDLPLKRSIRSNTRWHTYHYLVDVPVSFGYELRLKHLRLGAEAGLLFNLAKFTEGAYLQEGGQLAFFEASEPHPYRSRLGLGCHLGLQLQADLPVVGRLFLHPWWQTRPGNWLKEGEAIQKNYQQFGLNVGLRWRL